MSLVPTSGDFSAPYLYHELVKDRIRTLHREAEEHRMAARITRVRKARRDVRRANERLSRALSLGL
ncbi:hypothetical protein OUY22_24175 [Nonomuraea sp. MCN248]|uniref:Uncharacterized protein n=1 Tax=Nonomuraea corallina TaxID=2989783 RepID=A0ABT4SH32_9ACTN|nr:hypothetical protein [Nonomuraea corallina]MDA0636524.1 hypothetical protein [Nonomuraea corallina]